jgi:16S rRNA (uracil1498-N3)-methyltransferase
MDETRPKVRLYVSSPLAAGGVATLDAGQAHYLRNVMRLSPGDGVRLFNGVDGEWLATVDGLSRKGGGVTVGERLRAQTADADLWLLFAPVKRAPLDLLVQKAVELGVSRLQPVLTRRTVVERVNIDRLDAIAVEAAEQSQRMSMPEVAEPVELAAALDDWPARRRLYFCDTGEAPPMAEALASDAPGSPGAVLIGPEGGFDPGERQWLAALPYAAPVSLGPRILRAETAALAALVLWQSAVGDWRSGA